MTTKLSTAQTNTVSQISSLVLINAMVFQEILADHDGRVHPLQKILAQTNILDALSAHWQFILEEIDYYPIFHIARKIILNLTASQDVVNAIRGLAATAQRIVSMRAALRHDLMGRVYHRLLAEAKYLGTYYTSIPAATMLLKLALHREAWQTMWHDLDEVAKLRIADLACGTGTLLMAAADALSDNHIHTRAGRGLDVDLPALHRVLVEEVLCGYDVLPSAIHLTASTLALRAPQIDFNKMNLFSLPLGGHDHRLGSIEFLRGRQPQMVFDLFIPPSVEQVAGKEVKEIQMDAADLPDIDLCVMNPPFTRSVGGNLLFGSVPQTERKQMQRELRKLVQSPNVLANITAGLGSVFVAVADRYIKPSGRIALVLPKAVLSGVAWDKTRELLRQKYRLEYVVASQDPQRWNFSENTDLSEVLLVAAKVESNTSQKTEPEYVTALNLWRNPNTAFEALAVSHALITDSPPDVAEGQGALKISLGNEKVGEAIVYPWDDLKDQYMWMLPCGFAQSDLIRAAYHLVQGNLWLPGYGRVGQVQLCALEEFGDLGPDRRDIYDGFDRSAAATVYPAFWGHNAKDVYTLAQEPNCYLSPLSRARKDRPLRKVEDLWPLAGKVLIAERLRLNTQKLAAARITRSVLSNVWWPFAFKDQLQTDQHEKAFVLWLNSTLGLLLFLVHRQETEGAWVDFKKPVLTMIPVLNLTALSSDQLRNLASAYDSLCNEAILPFPEMNTDPVRAEIDKSIAQVLKIPDFSSLRGLLGQEPVVCLRRL